MDIEKLIEDARKQLGKESIMLLNGEAIKVPVIPTGLPDLDKALGVGGIPKGRIIEIYGPESSGKTTLCLKIAGQAQQQHEDNAIAFVDAEHALDPEWAKKQGVNMDKVLISQPNCGEEALETVEFLVKQSVPLIIVDSVAAMTPRAEINGDYGDSHMGLQARMMGQAMRKLVSLVHKYKSVIIFTNQIRMKIGVMFGNPETTPGGRALKFYSSVRLDIRSRVVSEEDKVKDEIVRTTCKVKIVKNKVAPPFKLCVLKLSFERGFDLASNIFSILLDMNIIEKKGNTYSLEGERLGVGKRNAMETLASWDKKEHDKLYNKIMETKVKTNKKKKKKKKRNKQKKSS